jgi:RNA polymerase sigma-70 factor (ECF subfamily)
VERHFDDLYYATYSSVLRAVVLLVPTIEDAHDIAQDAFARALARWEDVRRLDVPEAWVRKVAVNAAIDLRRREHSRLKAYRKLLGGAQPAPAADPVRIDVERALAALSPGQRRAVVLHHLLDMSVAQIAEETGQPTGTIKTNLARGRAALAAALRVSAEVSLDV